MSKYEVKFCVTFEVEGTPDTSTLRDALRLGIDKACDEGFLTPDDESSSVVSSSIYHIYPMDTKMNPTLEQFERAFPGKGQEISNLIEKRTLTTSYGSVLRLINKYQGTPPPYCRRLLAAIGEVASADTWFEGVNYFGFGKNNHRVVWDFTLNGVVLTKGR